MTKEWCGWISQWTLGLQADHHDSQKNLARKLNATSPVAALPGCGHDPQNPNVLCSCAPFHTGFGRPWKNSTESLDAKHVSSTASNSTNCPLKKGRWMQMNMSLQLYHLSLFANIWSVACDQGSNRMWSGSKVVRIEGCFSTCLYTSSRKWNTWTVICPSVSRDGNQNKQRACFKIWI